MTDRVRSDRSLLWSGEHWIGYLRRPGEEESSGSVSIWRTGYSEAGEGSVALARVPGERDIRAFYTDSPDLVAFISDNVIRWEVSPFEKDYPVVEATISRGGQTHGIPSWTIDDGTHFIDVKWTEVQPPYILDQPSVELHGTAVTHSLLFFCDGLSIDVDGEAVDGEVFERPGWADVIGKPGTSAVYALAETMCRI